MRSYLTFKAVGSVDLKPSSEMSEADLALARRCGITFNPEQEYVLVLYETEVPRGMLNRLYFELRALLFPNVIRADYDSVIEYLNSGFGCVILSRDDAARFGLHISDHMPRYEGYIDHVHTMRRRDNSKQLYFSTHLTGPISGASESYEYVPVFDHTVVPLVSARYFSI